MPGAEGLKPCPYCAEEIQATATVCRFCKADLAATKGKAFSTQRCSEGERDEFRRRLGRLNTVSFLTGIPGLLLQFSGHYLAQTVVPGSPGAPGRALLGVALTLGGAALLIVGLAFNARYKGRSGWWGLLGLLSCLGLLILYYISKRCQRCGAAAGYSAKECARCIAPV